ncbi:MAG: hypothetical protein JWP18_1534 [Solirubrobacterales bacterium]|jgi:hypothetical protein|nr:hypothetical protein [Solirubrobacterales bacterium]
MTSTANLIQPTPIVALRPASDDDAATLRRLAALDSAPVPAMPALLGIVDGHAVAALSLTTGAVVADPFTPTTAVVELLALRAARLRHAVPVQGLFQRARDGLPGRRQAVPSA